VRHGGGFGGNKGKKDAALNYTLRKPVGVVGLVTPWNLPLYLLTWKLGGALAMGNSVVAKPSEFTPATATALASLFEEAGLPAGIFNVVHGEGAVVGDALCKHPDVSALSFTGGTATGRVVAGAVSPRFAKLSLELGGKNACIIFADCDLHLAVAGAVRACFLNSSQICLCTSRVLVEDDGNGFYERFRDRFVAATKALVIGNPTEDTTDLGPLISKAQLDKCKQMCDHALKNEGGTLLCGGLMQDVPFNCSQDGYWWQPAIVEDVARDSPLAQEEVFGPVVTLQRFEGEADAVETANGTRYGLAASLWTEDITRAHRVGGMLDAGTVWINCWLHRQLDMPFGGTKESGVAREGGLNSLDFYSEQNTVCVKLGDRTPPPMPGFQGQQRRAYSTTRGQVRFLSSSNAGEDFVASAPKPMGAYPHARCVEAGAELIFLAGIGPRDPATDEVPGGNITDVNGERREYDITAQTKQCIVNVETVLKAQGLTLEDLVDCQVFLVDMKRDFHAFNAVYSEMIGVLPQPPTRTTRSVLELPPGGRIGVELTCIAQRRPKT